MKKTRKVILIMCDSQRWDMVGCYADRGLSTPNIDALAAQGVRFDRAYTTQPVCQPARAGIFTGMLPHSCGSFTNGVGLADNTQSIGKRLQDAGVHTALIGKWHLDGGDYFGKGICPDGFDPEYWYDMRNYLEELTEEERRKSRQPIVMDTEGVSADFTYAHRCTDRAVDFLQKHGEEDFFLTVSYDEPHQPHLCPEPYCSMYADYAFPKLPSFWDDLSGKPEHQRVWASQLPVEDREQFEIRQKWYFGCNSFVDYEVGRIMEAIDRYAEEALVIYTSDHGDFLSHRSLFGKGPAAYDDITRIPLIVRRKGEIGPGRVDGNPVSHLDLAPTIFEAMGVEAPGLFQGNSLVRELEDPTVRTNECIYIEFGRYELGHDGFGGFQPMRTIFDGRYKLTLNLLTTDELYDLQEDPFELENRIGDEATAAIRDRLHDRLLEKMNETIDPFRGYYWERRPWRRDARPATWPYTLMTRERFNEPYEPHPLDYATGLPLAGEAKPNEALKDRK